MAVPAQPMIPATPLVLAPYPQGAAPPRSSKVAGLTWSGAVFFVITLMVGLSAFKAYRIEVGGLLVHAYLIPMAPLFAFMVLNRIGSFPALPLFLLVVFTILYVFATLAGPGYLQESAKILAATATVITSALMVRSQRDFRVASIGLMIAMAGLSFLALLGKSDSFDGANPLEAGNENAFSLYTLPAVLLAGFICLDKQVAKWIRLPLVLAILVVVVAMFSNANRSGWLGLALIAAMLFIEAMMRNRGHRAGPLILMFMMVVLSYYAVTRFGDLNLLGYRFQETFSGQSSDDLRIRLLWGCWTIAINNPILGVSPQNMVFELGVLVPDRGFAIDPHNVFGYIMGGTGLITTTLFLGLGWTLYRRPIPKKLWLRPDVVTPAMKEAFRLMRMMLILWVIRGAFTREILYAPAFCIGLGLVIGLCISQGLWTKQRRAPASAMPVGQYL